MGTSIGDYREPLWSAVGKAVVTAFAAYLHCRYW